MVSTNVRKYFRTKVPRTVPSKIDTRVPQVPSFEGTISLERSTRTCTRTRTEIQKYTSTKVLSYKVRKYESTFESKLDSCYFRKYHIISPRATKVPSKVLSYFRTSGSTEIDTFVLSYESTYVLPEVWKQIRK